VKIDEESVFSSCFGVRGVMHQPCRTVSIGDNVRGVAENRCVVRTKI